MRGPPGARPGMGAKGKEEGGRGGAVDHPAVPPTVVLSPSPGPCPIFYESTGARSTLQSPPPAPFAFSCGSLNPTPFNDPPPAPCIGKGPVPRKDMDPSFGTFMRLHWQKLSPRSLKRARPRANCAGTAKPIRETAGFHDSITRETEHFGLLN